MSTVFIVYGLFSHTRNSSLDELLAHRFARSEETILDRAERQARHFRNLVIAHVV